MDEVPCMNYAKRWVHEHTFKNLLHADTENQVITAAIRIAQMRTRRKYVHCDSMRIYTV